jgi:hypothetical protein
MLRTLAQYLRERREDAIDRVSITLFLFITRRAPLPILRTFNRELLAVIRERLAAELAEAERQQTPAA